MKVYRITIGRYSKKGNLDVMHERFISFSENVSCSALENYFGRCYAGFSAKVDEVQNVEIASKDFQKNYNRNRKRRITPLK